MVGLYSVLFCRKRFQSLAADKSKGLMKRRTRQAPRKHGEARRAKRKGWEKPLTIIQPDPLRKEVEEANEHIANPDERERVIPSRPC